MAEQLQLNHMTILNTRETRLIQQIAEGNKDALHTLYAQYSARMLAFARRLVDDADIAEDIVQESLIVVWQDAHCYRRKGRVLSWLLGIVHNKARRIYRQRKHEPLDAEKQIPAAGQLPEGIVIEGQEKQLLWQHINQLKVEHRAVLDLVFFHNLSLKETAAVLNCPVGTVKSRLNYAKKALRGAYLREESENE